MHLTILGASGATGQEITRQALERGHTVTAVARNPLKIAIQDADRLKRVSADVRDSHSIAQALADSTIVLSGLGVVKGDKPGVLTAGAQAVVDARLDRIIWLGAFGTGVSAVTAGLPTRLLLQTFLRDELEDKVTADTLVLNAGGTVFHAGQISNGPLSLTRRTVSLDQVPRRLFPASVSRATLVAAMLDEAESQHHAGHVVVPLDR
ncbi:MAG: NAD(P)H-binding protein [Ktedonobacteraceae bacterium]|nr:NAD(P)H-binding protein [Ktedonobacteraceae bacterium]